ncbi:TIR domain-containing protein [Aeromonas hydrophila]
MSYRNKTYIIFDADNDMPYYRLMTAWKEHDHIEFDFHNAHELNRLTDRASEEQIKSKLRERLSNTKQVLVLVGNNTRYLYKFVRWEMEVAMSLDLPIIAVNLDKSNGETVKTPPILAKAYYVSVPFEMKKIKFALDNFPSQYHREKRNGPAALSYNWGGITL